MNRVCQILIDFLKMGYKGKGKKGRQKERNNKEMGNVFHCDDKFDLFCHIACVFYFIFAMNEMTLC